MEMTVKKREWVKNAAIIFLAVMLVLTFFSNTIMNKSLPEVATQYVQSGEITSKIRGSGLVTANGSYDVMTVYDNIAFGLRRRKEPKHIIDEKVKAAAEILEITDLLKRKPKQLSGGQRQRVAIGRAIVRNPKAYLMVSIPSGQLSRIMRAMLLFSGLKKACSMLFRTLCTFLPICERK